MTTDEAIEFCEMVGDVLTVAFGGESQSEESKIGVKATSFPGLFLAVGPSCRRQ